MISVLLSGCQPVAYYSQAVGGQMDIWMKQRDIEAVLNDPRVEATTKAQLQAAQNARTFASEMLGLPDNDSYSRFADIGRKYVVWNVVVTPRYSVEPLESCFPVVGCVSYRGYYAKEAALAYAREKKETGLDVHVGGVTAYSTLGWFDDPLLNTMLGRSDAAIAGLIFHELAHQKLFIKGDTGFNESFATAVENIGLRQWVRGQAADKSLQIYFSEKQKRSEIVKLVLESRERMREVYAKNELSAEPVLADVKREQFEQLVSGYADLKQAGGGTPGFDRFFQSELNNASLALFGEYHRWTAAFERLFEKSNNNWENFYAEVEAISRKTRMEREDELRALES